MQAIKRVASDRQTLDAIARIMSGRQWTPETIEDVADLVRLTGREIRDIDEDEALDEALDEIIKKMEG